MPKPTSKAAKPAETAKAASPVDGTDAPRTPATSMAVPKAQSTRNVQALFDAQRGSEAKPTLHLVVVGHVDAGKSTLMGHTLLDLGAVTQRAMHKYETESQKIGKSSFMYAWVLDETGEERERGITMDVGSVRFETPTKAVTLLDAPGHKDFIPNMIAGTTQADVALLVVDATRGEFETGFEQGGQTREHAILVRSLGVSQLGVVVNKLDTVGWSRDRFDEIVGKLKPFLQQVGFRAGDITFVPCSGLTGENLVRAAKEEALVSWYTGPTLAHVIDSFKVPPRNIDQPFRMTISDIFKPVGSGLCLAGRIETGALAAGDKVLACPLKEPAIVKSVSIDEQSRPAAFAGDHVTVLLNGLDLSAISTGSLLCDILRPVPIATTFQARIVVFSVAVPLTVGSPVLLHHQALVEPASIGRLKALLHKQTGEVLKKSPRCLGNGSCALIVLQTSRPICVEAFADCKELGRVTLRVGGVTVAAGVITKVLK